MVISVRKRKSTLILVPMQAKRKIILIIMSLVSFVKLRIACFVWKAECTHRIKKSSNVIIFNLFELP